MTSPSTLTQAQVEAAAAAGLEVLDGRADTRRVLELLPRLMVCRIVLEALAERELVVALPPTDDAP